MARLRSMLPLLVAYGLLVVGAAMLARGYAPVRVHGGSMRPALAHGDIAVVARGLTPSKGEIALLRSGPGFVLHRVRGVQDDGTFVTRGDANPVDDFVATSREDVRGEVVGVLPVGKMLERWR